MAIDLFRSIPFDDAVIINAKEKRPPKPLAKALTLFNQLLDFYLAFRA